MKKLKITTEFSNNSLGDETFTVPKNTSHFNFLVDYLERERHRLFRDTHEAGGEIVKVKIEEID